jgi:hypothetical protein
MLKQSRFFHGCSLFTVSFADATKRASGNASVNVKAIALIPVRIPRGLVVHRVEKV